MSLRSHSMTVVAGCSFLARRRDSAWAAGSRNAAAMAIGTLRLVAAALVVGVVSPAQTVEEVRRELQGIYKVHRPHKLSTTIDGLLAEYEGSEDVLLEAVQRKYGLFEEDGPNEEEEVGGCDADLPTVVWPNDTDVTAASGDALPPGCEGLTNRLDAADFFRPLGTGAFVSKYWGRSPLALKRSVCQPNRNYEGAGLEDWARLFPGAFNKIDTADNLALLSFRSGDMYVNLQRLYANPFVAYLDGVSMIINSADCHWGDSASWALKLREALPHVFETAPTLNVYLTPASGSAPRGGGGGGGGVQPFPLHNDEQDVYVLQVSGVKNWRVQDEPSERYKGQLGGGADQPDVPALRTALTRGDMLYIPRHHNHEGWTTGGQPSVSVSVTMGYNRSQADGQAAERHYKCQKKISAKNLAPDSSMSKDKIIAPLPAWLPIASSAGGVKPSAVRKRITADIRERLGKASPKEARKPETVLRSKYFRVSTRNQSPPPKLDGFLVVGMLIDRDSIMVMVTPHLNFKGG